MPSFYPGGPRSAPADLSRGHLAARREDGTYLDQEVTITPVKGGEGEIVRYVVVRRDITDRMRAQKEAEALRAQLMHADRLAVVDSELGTRQVLSRIESSKEMLQDSLEGIERIVQLVRDLCTFARTHEKRAEEVALADVVRDAVKMVRHALRHRARLDLDLADDPCVCGDRARLGQVVMNLLMNAAHAIDAENPAENCIRVSTRREGDEAMLLVEDTGWGIPEDDRERIFEPFLTTKRSGEGTGLGLSLCRKIVKKHQGRIEVESEVGKGTRFYVRMPAAGPPRAAPPPPAAAPSQAPVRARVLIIDDEPQLRRAYRGALSSHHDVVLTEGGRAALALLEEDRAFDVILCDWMLPAVDGPRIFAAHKERAPERRGS